MEEVKSFDEHITNEDEEEAVAEDERTEIAILDSEPKNSNVSKHQNVNLNLVEVNQVVEKLDAVVSEELPRC